jgi:hypothetical protein
MDQPTQNIIAALRAATARALAAAADVERATVELDAALARVAS